MSLVSYIFFWMCELLRPGFVSRSFSVHVFLMAIILFGCWWASVVEEYTDRVRLQHTLVIFFGVFLSVIVWQTGRVFDVWRLPLAALCLFVPFLTWRLMRYK